MADFRRWFIALAILAMLVGAASAQVGAPTGSANAPLACTALAGAIPTLRPEGYTELLGDIVITCTGGPPQAAGTLVPTTNIQISVSPTLPITSRLFGAPAATGSSEALLLVDEPGSTVAAAVPNYGPQAAQTPCSLAMQQTGPQGSCAAYVGIVGTGASAVEVAMSAPPSTGTPLSPNAPNVFQGQVGGFGNSYNSWTVTFYNVPVLPPATTGLSRVYRITNIRVPIASSSITVPISVQINSSPSTAVPLNTNTVTVGVVGPAMTAGVKQATPPFLQCIAAGTGAANSSTTVALAATLSYTEGFATAFKTRVVPGGAANNLPPGSIVTTGTGINNPNYTWASVAPNTAPPYNQNIPGGLYGGFSSNSESGFISTLFTGTQGVGASAVSYTAGLADYGTRLKAVFYNTPAGVTLYVSNASLGTPPTTPGGTSTSAYAVLVGTATSQETTADALNSLGGFGIAGNQVPNSTFTSFSALVGANGTSTVPVVQLTQQTNGTYEAVWEVVNSNPSAIDVLKFGVYISYTPTSANLSAPGTAAYYGTPITNAPNEPPNMVQLSFAPDINGGLFAAANSTQGDFPIPRFSDLNTYIFPWLTINLCQTTLLYPYTVSGFPGPGGSYLDTGLAIANTTYDIFNTVKESGSCTLYAYGVTASTSGGSPVANQTTVYGCDSPLLAVPPAPGVNCFPVVQSGELGIFDLYQSTLLNSFQGYIIAVCNFLYAHGYASVSDIGLRNLFSNYLALELDPEQGITCVSGVCNGSLNVGSPRVGTQGVEQLVH